MGNITLNESIKKYKKNNGYRYFSNKSNNSGKNNTNIRVFISNTKANENLKKILFIISPVYYYNTLRNCLQYDSFKLKY